MRVVDLLVRSLQYLGGRAPVIELRLGSRGSLLQDLRLVNLTGFLLLLEVGGVSFWELKLFIIVRLQALVRWLDLPHLL
jgi:hypothetical protein